MRRVIRGYGKTKISISLLLARSLSLIARINALLLLARIKNIWSDKERRSLRKKRFVSCPLQTEWMTVLGRPRWSVHYIRRQFSCGAATAAFASSISIGVGILRLGFFG